MRYCPTAGLLEDPRGLCMAASVCTLARARQVAENRSEMRPPWWFGENLWGGVVAAEESGLVWVVVVVGWVVVVDVVIVVFCLSKRTYVIELEDQQELELNDNGENVVE